MTSNELKELVKQHFSLVEAPATEEIVETEEQMSAESTEEVVEEIFGEIADENKAFTLIFPGEKLEVGDEVKVRTTDGQELSAPDGEHKLEGGITIKTEGGKVVEIMETEAMAEEEAVEEDVVDESEDMEVEVEVEEPSMKEVVEAIAEAVKQEMESIKDEMKYLKEKVEKMEEAPATEKSAPANFSALNQFGDANAEPFNKDRFEAVMARFAKK